MTDILVYALHYEGAFNKNSLGAVSEGSRLAGELDGECHVLVMGGDDLSDELCGLNSTLRSSTCAVPPVSRASNAFRRPIITPTLER